MTQKEIYLQAWLDFQSLVGGDAHMIKDMNGMMKVITKMFEEKSVFEEK